MIVVATLGIEVRPASRAVRVTHHILENGQHCSAGTAKHRLLVPFTLRPNRDPMAGERLVAILAGIVSAATFQLDGDNVVRSVIVLATGLRIEI